MLFYSMFKTLVGKEIAVELKNDVALTGTLHSIDQRRAATCRRHPALTTQPYSAAQ